jgi:hypothetical protein
MIPRPDLPREPSRLPTLTHHRLLDQLADFRTFLAEVDQDRVNRMNLPKGLSTAPDKLWAWALALGIEHAWGEQFASAVLNIVGLETAFFDMEQNLPEQRRRELEILDLHLK